MKKIPDRWGDYVALGKVIKGTRFLAFKVPLSEHLSQFLPEGINKFTPDILVDHVKEQGNELGLVIDLTNTTRYYQRHHLEKHNIRYEKIFTEGHVVPSLQVRKQFFGIVDSFLSSCQNEKRLIGVHCTHGLNRTGYLICRYMIDKMSRDPEECIQAFNEARGHNMERQNYLENLKQIQLPFQEEDQPAEALSPRGFNSDCNLDMGRRFEGSFWQDQRTPKFSQSHAQGYTDNSPSRNNWRSRESQPDQYYSGLSHPYHSRGYTPDKTKGSWRNRDQPDDIRRPRDRDHFDSRHRFNGFNDTYYDYGHYHPGAHPNNFGHYNSSYRSHDRDMRGNRWRDRSNHWYDRGNRSYDRDMQNNPLYGRGMLRNPSYGRDMQNNPSYSHDRESDSLYGHDVHSDASRGHDVQSDPSYSHMQCDPSRGHDVQSNPSRGHDVQSNPSRGHDLQSDPSYGHDVQSDPSRSHNVHSDPSYGHDGQSGPSYGHDGQSDPSYNCDS